MDTQSLVAHGFLRLDNMPAHKKRPTYDDNKSDPPFFWIKPSGPKGNTVLYGRSLCRTILLSSLTSNVDIYGNFDSPTARLDWATPAYCACPVYEHSVKTYTHNSTTQKCSLVGCGVVHTHRRLYLHTNLVCAAEQCAR
jgi:hypothetical protein